MRKELNMMNKSLDPDDTNTNNDTSDSSNLETLLFTSTAVDNVSVCFCVRVFALILYRFFVLCRCRGNADRRDLEQDEQLQQVQTGHGARRPFQASLWKGRQSLSLLFICED